MGKDKEATRKKSSPIDTGQKTVTGRTIWRDPKTGKDYSERSTTFEIDGIYYTMPTVDKKGSQYTQDQIREYVKEYGPIDYITGEELPQFKNEEDAIEYAIIRSKTRKQKEFNKGGDVNSQTKEVFSSGRNRPRRNVSQDYLDRSKEASKQTVENIAGMLPGVGTAITVSDIKEELGKDDPNYGKVGLMVAGEAVGLVPGVGQVGKALIRKTTTKLFDKAADAKEAERLLKDPEALEQWRKENKLPESQRQKNPEGSKKAASDLLEGEITSKESRQRIKDFIPDPEEFTAEQVLDMMPSLTEITGSLGKKAKKYPIIGVKGADLKKGQTVSSRLDIPAYDDYNTWVVSIHDGNQKSGSVVGYGQAIRLKNINFGSDPKTALDIARGKRLVQATGEDAPKPQGKATIARIFGKYQPEDPYDLQQQAAEIIASGSKEWTQVGMNPYRGSAFYNKKTGAPVFEADEIIQVGPLVLAKNVKKPTISQMKQMAVRTRDGKLRMFNEGGTAMNKQMEMAFMQQGGIKDDGMAKDPVSGNPIPPGSMAKEVRDDIPAMLSEGEYVVPADVLRFYGVNFFEDLRGKAKQGLQNMEANGRIGGEPLSPQDINRNMQKPAAPSPAPRPQTKSFGSPLPIPFDPNSTTMSAGGVAGYNISGLTSGMPNSSSNVGQNQSVPINSYPNQPASGFSPSSFNYVGASTFGPIGDTITQKTFVNSNDPNDKRIVMFKNGEVYPPSMMPFTKPPYFEQGSASLKKQAEPEVKKDRDGGGGKPPPDPDKWMDKYDYTNADTLVQQTKSALDPGSGGFLGNLNPLSQIMSAGTVAEASANIRLLEAKGIDVTELNEMKSTFIEKKGIQWIQDTIPGVMDGDILANNVTKRFGKDDNFLSTGVNVVSPPIKTVKPDYDAGPTVEEYKEDAKKKKDDDPTKTASQIAAELANESGRGISANKSTALDFSKPSPHQDMSQAKQYASYGAGRASFDANKKAKGGLMAKKKRQR